MRMVEAPASAYPGLSLRPLERTDLDAWYACLSQPEVVRHTSWNLDSKAALEPMFDAFESSDAESPRRLAIIEDASGQLVGTIGFHTVSAVHRTAEIAYELSPSHWGRGIATAMCAGVSAWAFHRYGWVRIQAAVLESNRPSARVLQRCGYRHEGLLRAYRMVRGEPGDFHLYARLATD